MGKFAKIALSAVVLVAVLVAVLIVTTRGDDKSPAGSASGPSQSEQDTFTFAVGSEASIFDPVFTGRANYAVTQMFETLVALKPGTDELVPSLATSWTSSDDGTEWTFKIREGVKFHDETALDAKAVCFNYDRWYNFDAAAQGAAGAYAGTFGGFKTGDSAGKALYVSCTTPDPMTAVIKLKSPIAPFLAATSVYYFGIHSPAALEKYGADEPGTTTDDGTFVPGGTYNEHPTGTGPYKFVSFTPGVGTKLVRNDDYWGSKALIKNVVIRAIPDAGAKLQALETGEIDAYDNPEPQTYENIKSDPNLQIIERPAYNIGYLGINQENKPLDKLQVRQALAYGLNRQQIVDTLYAGLGEVANQFVVPSLFGYSDNVQEYSYDPEKSKQLLRDAGLTLPVEIVFDYPTGVARPYMPQPKRIFEAFAAGLEDAGFKIVAKPAPWVPDYIGKVLGGKSDGLFILGYINDKPDPSGFLEGIFGDPNVYGLSADPSYVKLIDEAATLTDRERRAKLYEQANEEIMKDLPMIPFVSAKSGIAAAADVQGYVASPTTMDFWNTVYIKKQ